MLKDGYMSQLLKMAIISCTSHDINQFRSVLKSFLLINSFYSEEYFAWNSNRDLGSLVSIVSYIMYGICNLISVLTSSISDGSQPLRMK